MKKLSFILAIGLLSVISFSRNTVAQEKPFITLEYMYVKPGNANAYMQVENLWRKIHIAQQKKGNIITWSVWQVVAPYNMNAEYQYVVVTAYPHFSDYLHPYKGIDIPQLFPNVSEDSLNKMFAETPKARDLVRRDIFQAEDHISDGKDTKYVLAWYVKVLPGKEDDFESFMKNHRKPIHADIIKRGLEHEWWYGGLMFAGGDKASYNHIIAVQWDRDDMFDKLPPFAQYKKKDPAAFEDHKWLIDDHAELLHKVISLKSEAK